MSMMWIAAGWMLITASVFVACHGWTGALVAGAIALIVHLWLQRHHEQKRRKVLEVGEIGMLVSPKGAAQAVDFRNGCFDFPCGATLQRKPEQFNFRHEVQVQILPQAGAKKFFTMSFGFVVMVEISLRVENVETFLRCRIAEDLDKTFKLWTAEYFGGLKDCSAKGNYQTCFDKLKTGFRDAFGEYVRARNLGLIVQHAEAGSMIINSDCLKGLSERIREVQSPPPAAPPVVQPPPVDPPVPPAPADTDPPAEPPTPPEPLADPAADDDSQPTPEPPAHAEDEGPAATPEK